MRSPRSASATSNARSRSGGIQKCLHLAFRVAVDQGDAAGKLADLGQELARPLFDDGRDVPKAVALRDCDMAGQNDKHSRSDLAGFK
jgi:hypothetical protein